MTIEYPDYYEKFRCIGGACPDTCCAGWEVDIDEETAAYYLEQEGPFGERLRCHMRPEADEDRDMSGGTADTTEGRKDSGEDGEQGSGWYFPLTSDGRCPFLNRENLCDIYTALGEESLCQVCTEYPRYFAGAGDYQQIDMSLSCMELGRIFFSEKDRIHYFLSENDADGEDIAPEDRERLDDIIGQRCDWIELLQGEDGPLEEKLSRILTEGFFGESDETLLRVMGSQEVLDHRWEEILQRVRENLPALKAWKPAEALPQDTAADYERWFTKLSVYFLFRYAIDAFADGGMEPELRLLARSLRMIHLMCAERAVRTGTFSREDMIDIAHIYSRQTEHSLENVELVKNLS